MTLDQIAALDRYADSTLFSDRERLALRYAEHITRSDLDVDAALFEQVRAEFGDPVTIVQLTLVIAYENFRSKFNHALLVESNGMCLVEQAGGHDAHAPDGHR